MSNQTIARRYAQALLAIGQEDGKFDDYGKELAEFTVKTKESGLTEALTNPIYPSEIRRNILNQVLEKIGLSKTLQNFLKLLQDKDRIGSIDEIAANYQLMVDEVNNVKRATITTAGPIGPPIQKEIKSVLEKMTGKTIVLEAKEDPAIIGGILAQVGDLTLDGSVRTQLKNLKESLIKG